MLYEVAKKLKCNTSYEVGLKLGLSDIELDHLEDNNKDEMADRKMFNLLRMWRDRQGKISDKEVTTLNRVFRETSNIAALEELYSKLNKSLYL